MHRKRGFSDQQMYTTGTKTLTKTNYHSGSSKYVLLIHIAYLIIDMHIVRF